MGRTLGFVYGMAVYLVMFITFLYLFGFLANIYVPKSIDSGTEPGLGLALAVNLGLIVLFGVLHSVMARPGFKSWWTRYVPTPIERSTYVLVATASLILLMWAWQPMTGTVWQVDAAVGRGILWGLFILGIVILFASTFVIDHFDLFGLRQVTLNMAQRPYTNPGFSVTFFYKFVRHPLYVGWFLIFWATPDMTVGHLVFAIGMSGYILIAIPYEERDLVRFHGEEYAAYRQKVPMLIPRPGKVHATVKSGQAGPTQAT